MLDCNGVAQVVSSGRVVWVVEDDDSWWSGVGLGLV